MVRTTVDDRVHTIAFDRPEKKNSLTEETFREVMDALDRAAQADARAVVVTGEGDAFCAGGDIDAMKTRDETVSEAYDRIRGTLTAVIEAILTAPFPVVAKVNGDAVGAGSNIAATCDFAIAAEGARFGEVFVNVGLVPDTGGTYLLPHFVGLRDAKELTMTGRLFDATEAEELRLVNRAVPAADLDGEVAELLADLDRKPTDALAKTKRALHENLGRRFRDGLEREASLLAQAYMGDAHAEGVEAFVEGREPDFD